MRVLFLLLALVAAAQTPPPKRPAEILALVDQARALQPEFAADVMLRLAASRLIDDVKWKGELIEEAFVSGAHAQLPYRQRGDPTTDARSSQEVWPLDLEALTLQTRAVQAMLALNPQRALTLFDDIVAPSVPNASCAEEITPDVSAYYQTAGKVFAQTFTASQRKKEDDIHFLQRRLGSLQSPADVVPALKLLFEAELTPVQRKQLTAVFASTLERVNGSDRVFGTTESGVVPAALPAMHDTAMLLPAVRSYILRHVAGPRCSDHIKPGKLPDAADQFNKLLGRLDPTGIMAQKILEDEAKPLKDDGTFVRHLFWQSARSKQVLEELRWLNHGNRDLPDAQRFWTLQERSTTEWNARYSSTMKLIEGWKEDEEDSPEDYLFMVAHTYATLAALVPPGTARENAMGIYLNFLETHFAATQNRNFWFAQVSQMLKRTHYEKDLENREWMLQHIARSSNPIIALYAQLERRMGLW